MTSFNLNKLRDFIPKDLAQVSLPRMPQWTNNFMENEDDDEERPLDDTTEFEDIPDGPAEMSVEEPIPIDTTKPKTYLDLLNEGDNFPYRDVEPHRYSSYMNTYYTLYVDDYPHTVLGKLLPSVVVAFRGLPHWNIDDDTRSLTLTTGSDEEERTRAVGATTQAMRATDHFAVLKGWRNELYPVYGPKGVHLFSIERSASPLFGVLTYGCHMTAYTYTKEKEGDENERDMKIWVPRRSATKQTYASMLDNTVAGGLSTGELPFEGLVREAQEEASLPEDLVRKGAKAVGTVTYIHIRDKRAGGETNLLQPECQYVYDLELPEDVVPKPSDDEVENFELLTVEEVKQALSEGQFKPNCALVMLDFFVRHGIITADDKSFIEIISRLHRRFEYLPTV